MIKYLLYLKKWNTKKFVNEVAHILLHKEQFKYFIVRIMTGITQKKILCLLLLKSGRTVKK